MDFTEYFKDQLELLEANEITLDQFLHNLRDFAEENYIGS